MKKTFLFAVFAAALALALAGCGGGAQPVSKTVKLSEFAFDPNSLEVPAGAEVNLTLDNSAGTLEHNFLIMNEGVQIESEFTDANQADIYFEELATAAGESVEISFIAPETPGVYQFICSVPGHLTQGMQGVLTVTAP